MLVRNCAGGIVFFGDKVFLLKDENGEWILPKETVHSGDLTDEVVLRKVKEEAGVSAEIISTAGRTNYEFVSVSRQRPICNKITWYIMKSLSEKYNVSSQGDFKTAGFFEVEEAIDLLSNSYDKALLNLSYKSFKELA